MKRFSVISLLVIIVFSLFLTSNVHATTSIIEKDGKITFDIISDDTPQINQEEEKIMCYDSATGETTEVNMDELRKSAITKISVNGGRRDRIEPPNLIKTSNLIIPKLLNSSFEPSPNVTTSPYKSICRIKAEVYGKELVASGYLAGPKVLVTAAHCVMNTDDNDATFADWVAYPGFQTESSYMNLSSGWSKIYYSNLWKSTHAAEVDWCICILNSDIGNTAKWLGTQAYGTDKELINLPVRLYGYPASLGQGEFQYYSDGIIEDANNYLFHSTTSGLDGFSGGPIVRRSDNYVVGIHRGVKKSDPSLGTGVRINQDMIDIIRNNL